MTEISIAIILYYYLDLFTHIIVFSLACIFIGLSHQATFCMLFKETSTRKNGPNVTELTDKWLYYVN
jgi:hypothetical protein